MGMLPPESQLLSYKEENSRQADARARHGAGDAGDVHAVVRLVW